MLLEVIETPKQIYTITVPLTIMEVNQIEAALGARMDMLSALAQSATNYSDRKRLEEECSYLRAAFVKLKNTPSTRGPLHD